MLTIGYNQRTICPQLYLHFVFLKKLDMPTTGRVNATNNRGAVYFYLMARHWCFPPWSRGRDVAESDGHFTKEHPKGGWHYHKQRQKP